VSDGCWRIGMGGGNVLLSLNVVGSVSLFNNNLQFFAKIN
jgi:hypothetical protein